MINQKLQKKGIKNMTTYGIETACNMFTGSAHIFLLDIIAQSSPDYFTKTQLETASEIEEGKIKYSSIEHDEFEIIEYVKRSNK